MKLVFLVVFTLFYLTSARRIRCESFCKFRFCFHLNTRGPVLLGDNRAILVGIPDDPVGPIPCKVSRRGRTQVLYNVTGGEAQVSREFSMDPFVPISDFMTDSVEPSFPEDYFSWVFNEGNGRQSIGRRASMGNQDPAIDQVCVRMPVRSFNLLHRDGSVRRSATTRGRRACVGFRTQVPMLLVHFRWFSSNDFDLRLQEPSGVELNRKNMMSESGGMFIFDAGKRFPCDIELGTEQVRYLRSNSDVEPGTYTIRVNHLTRCSMDSRYVLRVLYKGSLIVDEEGTISDIGDDVLVRTFEIPSEEM